MALGASAQPLSYTLLLAEGAKPSARFDGTIAYDPVGRQILLFGGSDADSRNDLWSYSLSQRRWTELAPEGARPPARFGHTLIYDSARRRAVVFGGQNRGFFNDVWAYDISANSWRQIGRDDAGPTRRYGHSGIYDAERDRMIVSHGFTDAGRFDDTWAFDFASNTWRDISPSSGRPLRRCLHHAAYDGANSQMLLYGGCASGFGPCPLGDLWSFDLRTNRWTEKTTQPRPSFREHYGIGFDAMRGVMLIFGGGPSVSNDTWEYDTRSAAWRQASIQGALPDPRSRHEGASDGGTAFFFGGTTNGGLSNELWMLGPAAASNVPAIAGQGVVNGFSFKAGPVAPGQIVTIYGSNLGPHDGISLSLDPVTRKLPAAASGVSVTFNGVAAPLYFVSSDQINVQAPYEIDGAAEAKIVVTVNGTPGEPVTVPVVAASPALFPRAFQTGGIVVLYATGQGRTSPASITGATPSAPFPEPVLPVSLRVGTREAEILFRGQAPGTIGVMQINARVAEGVAGDAVPVVLTIGQSQSQPVSLEIR